MSIAMTKWTSAGIGAALLVGGATLFFAIGALPITANSAGSSTEVQLPAVSRPGQRTALDLEVVFGKGARGGAVTVRHQPSGEVIGTLTPFGLGSEGGIGRFAITVPQDLETRLRRDHQPLRLELETHDVASGAGDGVVLRSVAPKLVPTAQ
jgi:hypothetical protein